MNAWDDLMQYLGDDESIEAVVFGSWGRDDSELADLAIPFEKRNIVLSIEEAKSFLKREWRFKNFQSLTCYAAYIWTNKRIIWVRTYDGATWLDSAPRNPEYCVPHLSGG